MPPPDQNPNTGNGRISANLAAQALGLAPVATQLAAGAKATDVAAETLKNAALDKLIGPTALFAGGMIGVLKTIRSIVKESGILEKGLARIGQMQQIEGKFETLLKSATLAKQRIKELYAFAANSPFKMGDVAEANRMLQALTAGALASAKGMKMVGDAAAATGQDMASVAQAVGKVYNALSSGRALDRTIFQLMQTGVVTDELADKLERLEAAGAGFSEKWGEVEKQLKRTEGGMKNEMRSLQALTSRLEEASAVMEQAFSSAFVEAQAKAIETSIKATKNLTPVLQQIGNDLAPILQFNKSLKDSIVESTLATKGFAEALSVMWSIGKVAFAGLAAAGVGKLLSTVGPGVAKVGNFVSGVAGNARTATAGAASGAAAATKFGAAGAAFGSDKFGLAASLAAEAVALKASSVAANVHSTAMRTAATSTGLMKAASYSGALGVQALGAAFGFLKNAALGAFNIFKAGAISIVTTFITGALSAAAAAGVAFLAWKRSVEDTTTEYETLSKAMADTNKKLIEQVRAADTVDKWTQSVNDLTTAMAAARAELDAMNAKESERGFFGRVGDFFTGNKRERDRGREAKAEQVGNLASLRTTAINRRGSVGLSDEERALAQQNSEIERAREEEDFNFALSNADDDKKIKLLQERQRQFRSRGLAGDAEAEARANASSGKVAEGKALIATDTRIGDANAAKDRAQAKLLASGITEDQLGELPQLKRDLATKQENATLALGIANKGTGTGGLDATRAATEKENLETLAKQVALLKEMEDAEKAAKDAAKEAAALRLKSESQIVVLNQRLNDLVNDRTLTEEQKGEKRRQLQLQILGIEQLIADRAANTQRADQLQKEVFQMQEAERISRRQLEWEEKIANARTVGLETASMELQAQMDILNEQLAVAEKMGQTLTVRRIKLQITNAFNDQQKAGKDFDTSVAIDRAKLNNDRLAEKKISDAQATEDLVKQGSDSGRNKDQILEAVATRIKADAASDGPVDESQFAENDSRRNIKIAELKKQKEEETAERIRAASEVVERLNPVGVTIDKRAANAVGANGPKPEESGMSPAAYYQGSLTAQNNTVTELKLLRTDLQTGFKIK